MLPCPLQLVLGNQILAEEKHLTLYKVSSPSVLPDEAHGMGECSAGKFMHVTLP